MREQFEDWAITVSSVAIERIGDDYADQLHQLMWLSWQASRDFLSIDLPAADSEFEYRFGGDSYFDGPKYADAVRVVIEAAGLKVSTNRYLS